MPLLVKLLVEAVRVGLPPLAEVSTSSVEPAAVVSVATVLVLVTMTEPDLLASVEMLIVASPESVRGGSRRCR